MVTPAVRRTAVAHLAETYEMSERRACRVIAADRSSVRYRRERPDDAPVRERLRALAAERRRFGYRRLHVLLRQEGLVMNRKRRHCHGNSRWAGSTVGGWYQAAAMSRQSAWAMARRVFSVGREIRWRWTLK